MTAIRILQRLSELVDDVTISSIANTDLLRYDSGSGKWLNITPSGATGVLGYLNRVGTAIRPTNTNDQLQVDAISYEEDTNSNISLLNRTLNADNSTISVDYQNHTLETSYGTEAANWENRALENSSERDVLDWESLTLSDSAGNIAANWATRQLIASDGADAILDWSTAGTAAFGDSDLTTTGTATATGGLRTKVSVDSINDPPTDEDLDSAFGTPAALGEGFVGILDDNSADTDVYICYTSDTSWFYIKGTKASPA